MKMANSDEVVEIYDGLVDEYIKHCEKGEKMMRKSRKWLKKRDELDSRRKVAPLTIPEGAVIIDTGRLSPEKVAQKILSFIN